MGRSKRKIRSAKPAAPAKPAEPAKRPARWPVLLSAGLICAAIALAWSNSLHGPFIFDDIPSIPENRTIRDLWDIPAVLSPPGDGVTVDSRPILNLSFAINYAISGMDVVGYHVGNIIIHALATLTLFGVVRRTLLLPSVRGRLGSAAASDLSAAGIALAVALLWGVHALQTESVTYMVQRAESLMGLLYLLTLYCVIRGAAAKLAWPWYAGAVAACAAGMASKEVTATAPVVILLYDVVFLAGSGAGLTGAIREVMRRRWAVYACFALSYAILVGLMISGGSRSGSVGKVANFDAFSYSMRQLGVITHYLRLSFWPRPLCLDYGWQAVRSAGEIVPGAIVVGGLLAATVWAVVCRPAWGFLGVWFFAILAPTSSVVPMLDAVFEHRMYLPLAAVVTVIVVGAVLAWNRLTAKPGVSAARWLVPALLLAVAATGLGVLTYQRNRDYASQAAIWEDAVAQYPDNHRARANLGEVYRREGKLVQAVEQFSRAIELRPNYPTALMSRGVAYMDLQLFDEALQDEIRAIELDPRLALAWNNRGCVLQAMGRFDEAVSDHTKAMELAPNFVNAYANRGVAYYRLGKYDLALADLTKAVELGGKADAYNNRGAIYMAAGRPELAIKDCDEAIRLDPNYVMAYENRGLAYVRLNQMESALRDFNAAIALAPSGSYYGHRGGCYNATGRYEQAAADFTKAIAMQPQAPMHYRNRAEAWYALKQYDRARSDLDAYKQRGGNDPALEAKLAQSLAQP